MVDKVRGRERRGPNVFVLVAITVLVILVVAVIIMFFSNGNVALSPGSSRYQQNEQQQRSNLLDFSTKELKDISINCLLQEGGAVVRRGGVIVQSGGERTCFQISLLNGNLNIINEDNPDLTEEQRRDIAEELLANFNGWVDAVNDPAEGDPNNNIDLSNGVDFSFSSVFDTTTEVDDVLACKKAAMKKLREAHGLQSSLPLVLPSDETIGLIYYNVERADGTDSIGGQDSWKERVMRTLERGGSASMAVSGNGFRHAVTIIAIDCSRVPPRITVLDPATGLESEFDVIQSPDGSITLDAPSGTPALDGAEVTVIFLITPL